MRFANADSVIHDPAHSELACVGESAPDIDQWIATSAYSLLNCATEHLQWCDLSRVYKAKLRELGFVSATGLVRVEKFADWFATTSEGIWLDTFVGKHSWRHCNGTLLSRVFATGSGTPTVHLILMRVLGIKPTQVSSPDENSGFEEGPWPCLNRVCVHYGRDVITRFETAREYGYLRGTFECLECGYVYLRKGPDESGATRNHHYKVMRTGQIWDRRLVELWGARTDGRGHAPFTIRKIGEALGAGDQSVLIAAERLGLNPFDKVGGGTYAARAIEKRRAAALATEKRRQEYRSILQSYLAEHPGATRRDLQEISGGRVANWLYRYDQEWFRSTRSILQRVERKKALMIDWSERDRDLASKVLVARARLEVEDGPIRRISKSRLLRAVCFKGVLFRPERLPLTAAALARSVESTESFASRRRIIAMPTVERCAA